MWPIWTFPRQRIVRVVVDLLVLLFQLVHARTRGQVDNEEDVQLEEDGDCEEDGVDDETSHTQSPAEDESGGQEDDVEQDQAEEEGDHGVGQTLGVDADQPRVVRRAADDDGLFKDGDQNKKESASKKLLDCE